MKQREVATQPPSASALPLGKSALRKLGNALCNALCNTLRNALRNASCNALCNALRNALCNALFDAINFGSVSLRTSYCVATINFASVQGSTYIDDNFVSFQCSTYLDD